MRALDSLTEVRLFVNQHVRMDVKMVFAKSLVSVSAMKVIRSIPHHMFALQSVENHVKTVIVPGRINALVRRTLTSSETVQRNVNPSALWDVRMVFVFSLILVSANQDITKSSHTIACHIVKFDVSMAYVTHQISVNVLLVS